MAIAGAVELVSNDKIVGWAVDTDQPHAARIDLCIDGTKVKTLKALRARPGFANLVPEGRVEFQFRLHSSLLRYVRSGSSLSFQLGGQSLPIVTNEVTGTGAHARPVSELVSLLQRGYVVTKKGRVQLSIHLDTDWQRQVFAFYDYARKKFQDLFGYDLHITYGTLLGHTRQQDFIPGDDDFDTSYVSRHTKPADVRDEFVKIASTLTAQGETIAIARRKLIQWKGPNGVGLDVFPSWLDGKNFYMTFAVGAPCGDAIREGFVEERFREHPVLVPKRKETLVAGIYGEGWRTPDPHFQWVVAKSLRRVMRAVSVDDAAMAEIYWNRVYRAGAGTAPPSSFAVFVSKQVPEDARAVIEFGCGNGRDTLEVAGPRRIGLGLDYSDAAVARNQTTWPEKDHPQLRFRQADVRDAESLRRATADAIRDAGGKVAIYSRFFIHAIDDEAEAVLRGFFESTLPAGTALFFEFRTHLDAVLEKTFGGHFRRFVNPDDFVARMTSSGKFKLTYRDVGTGLAPYKDEDPHVARLHFVAER